MVESHQLFISIGTNINQEEKLSLAKNMLRGLFTNIVFSSEIWTEPIGIQTDEFLNCIAMASTKHGLKQIERALKQIERRCGDTKSKRTENIISMDIDILQYGDEKFHVEDWKRDYVTKLMKELTGQEDN